MTDKRGLSVTSPSRRHDTEMATTGNADRIAAFGLTRFCSVGEIPLAPVLDGRETVTFFSEKRVCRARRS